MVQNLSEVEIEDKIKANTGLIRDAMRKLNLVGDSEAYSAGLWALYRAIKLYDPEASTAKFSTYAYCAIYNRVNGVHRSNNTLTNKNTILLREGETEGCVDPNFYDSIFRDSVDVAETTLTNERYDTVTKFTEAYIWSLKEHTIPKIIMSNWYYLHECDIGLGELADESNCSHAYVRKVLKEFRSYLSVYMKHQDED